MINKIIIPFLIIIFSLLIIYYILNKKHKEHFINLVKPLLNYEIKISNEFDNKDIKKKYKKKIDEKKIDEKKIDEKKIDEKNINENFVNKNILTENINNSPNNNISYVIYSLQGLWTNNNSIIKNNIIHNTTRIIIDTDNKKPNGKVFFYFLTKNKLVYNIKDVTDNSILCEKDDKTVLLYIRLLNDENSEDDVYKNTIVQYSGQKCLFSFYYPNVNKPFLRFISYQILKQPVDENLINIVAAKDWYIDNIKEPYDFKTYNIIIGKYKFDKKFIKIDGYNKNTDIFKKIEEKYPDGINLYIRRIYKSPSGKKKEIKTHISQPYNILIKNENDIPKNIKIISFKNDKKINSKKNYSFNKNESFKPISTYIYVAQLYHMQDTFEENIPKKKINKNQFQLHKTAKNMFNQNIEYIDINKLTKKIIYTYKIKNITTIPYSKEKEKKEDNPYIYELPFNKIIKYL
jgi:hypothetical protein